MNAYDLDRGINKEKYLDSYDMRYLYFFYSQNIEKYTVACINHDFFSGQAPVVFLIYGMKPNFFSSPDLFFFAHYILDSIFSVQ